MQGFHGKKLCLVQPVTLRCYLIVCYYQNKTQTTLRTHDRNREFVQHIKIMRLIFTEFIGHASNVGRLLALI